MNLKVNLYTAFTALKVLIVSDQAGHDPVTHAVAIFTFTFLFLKKAKHSLLDAQLFLAKPSCNSTYVHIYKVPYEHSF